MSKNKLPVTPAIRVLRREKVVYTDHLYDYVERGGTTAAATRTGCRAQN